VKDPLNYPVLIFFITFFVLWLAGWMGSRANQRRKVLADDALRDDYGVVQAATLTMLGLLVGFSFSMATGRYDLRKNYEEAEANAIGTEYVRADLLLPAEEIPRVKALLREYTAQRLRFYTAKQWDDIAQIRADTDKVQDELWKSVSATASAQPTVLRSLALSGMNDVLNSEGYTQAAWWNRIPVGAWCLMAVIALVCNWMVGFGAKRPIPRLLTVLPLVVAVAFFLIADIDTPRGGVIRVSPQNLLRLQAELK
jgi:hypothetical protein